MSETIPFLDLKAQYRTIKAEVDEAVLKVLGAPCTTWGRRYRD